MAPISLPSLCTEISHNLTSVITEVKLCEQGKLLLRGTENYYTI